MKQKQRGFFMVAVLLACIPLSVLLVVVAQNQQHGSEEISAASYEALTQAANKTC